MIAILSLGFSILSDVYTIVTEGITLATIHGA
jgi:hypothetical protein